ncbi:MULTISPECIES: class IV adenylate cyclase [unclassified Schlesneria]|uniref:class IV adenylate cyclase n=1 Tax=Schlesneria TaxID=656899 RepID=UPI00359F2665
MTKTYEVELKFRIEDPASIESLLRNRGATADDVVTHVDRYFNHPSRDFRQTDEALRIRSVGNTNCVTYKGAVIGTTAKTRHEIEVGFDEGSQATDQLRQMLDLLGFRFVREVRKLRRILRLVQSGQNFELALDEVPELGQSFLEIELLAEEGERTQAESAIWQLARSLGLEVAESRSYLNLLIDRDDATRQAD